jgi:broad specificity phosphatase PhoE
MKMCNRVLGRNLVLRYSNRMTTQLFLVRHGESTGNVELRFTGWLDAALTPEGVTQATLCGKKLKKSGPFDVVYCSDLVRARETAFGIAHEISFDRDQIHITKELREKNAGIFTGVTFEDAKKNHPDLYEGLMQRQWDYALPEGESNHQVADRVKILFDEILATHKDKKILVVSHGVTISHILRLFLCIKEEQFPKWVSFQSDNTCIHRLLFRDDGGCIVVSLNDITHLEAGNGE